MSLTAAEIIKKYTAASTIKTSWDAKYRDVIEYCMPARDGFAPGKQEKTDPEFQDSRARQFSSLGEQCAGEFVNTMQELLCPPQADWINLEAGTKFEVGMRDGVNKELEKLCSIANEHKNNSTFDIAFSEFCYDLFVGTACMLILPNTPKNPISFQAIPLKEYCVEEGRNGEVRGVFRNYTMKKELVKYQWAELKGMKCTAADNETDMQLIECTWLDYGTGSYVYSVVDKTAQKILLERIYKTSPFIVLRWNKCAGEPYGRGPGLTILNDVKTLNLIKEYSLRNFAFNIPPLLVQEDAMLDVESLELTPFSLNVVPNTETSIKPLQISTDHNIESYKVQELSMDIKRNSYCNTLPNEGDTQLTATEVNARRADLRRNLNSVFGRLIGEFQIPLVRRIFNILEDTTYVKNTFDVTKIDGLMYKVKVTTPLSKQLGASTANSIMGAVQLLTALDPTGGAMASLLKVNEMGVYLMDLMGVPAEFVNDAKTVTAKQQQIAESQAQAQQAATQQTVDAENAISLGKEEAKVLSK